MDGFKKLYAFSKNRGVIILSFITISTNNFHGVHNGPEGERNYFPTF